MGSPDYVYAVLPIRKAVISADLHVLDGAPGEQVVSLFRLNAARGRALESSVILGFRANAVPGLVEVKHQFSAPVPLSLDGTLASIDVPEELAAGNSAANYRNIVRAFGPYQHVKIRRY